MNDFPPQHLQYFSFSQSWPHTASSAFPHLSYQQLKSFPNTHTIMFPPHPPPLLSLDTVNLLGAPPLSPAETCSSTTSEFPPQTPPLQQQQSHHRPPVHVVCTAPLVAPRPLPYHSPTFIQFDLPDMDEDLSISPFPRNSGKKRQRDVYEDEENPDAVNGSGPPISQTCRSSLLSPPPHKKWQGDSSVPISHTIKPRRRMPRARFNSPYMTHLST